MNRKTDKNQKNRMSRRQASGSLAHPEPIRGNPSLRAETLTSGLTRLEKPNRNTHRHGQCNTLGTPLKSLHCVAACCTVFRPKIFTSQVQHLNTRPSASCRNQRKY